MLNVNRIITGTKAEGPGIRTCIWLQGCSRHCKGCFAADTWSPEPRHMMSCDELIGIIENDLGSEGVTILGGEPLEQIEPLTELLIKVKSIGKSIVLFSGFTLEEIKSSERFSPVLELADVLADGPYVEELRDFSRPMLGSKNQEFSFLTPRYKPEDFTKNKIELRISPDGRITINGQGDTIIFSRPEEDNNEIQ